MDNTTAIEVGITPVRIIHSDKGRTSLAVANMSAGSIVYISASPLVTIGTGFPIRAGTQMTWNKGLGDNPTIARWLVADAPAVDVRVTEEYEV